MRWLRLILSTILFPFSLLWYRRDVGPGGVGVWVYWPVMIGWVTLSLALSVLAYTEIKAQVDEFMKTFQ